MAHKDSRPSGGSVSVRERAQIAREERAKALQGFFTHSFVPADVKDDAAGQLSPEGKWPENKSPENKSPENKSFENAQFPKSTYCGNLISAAREVNFTALGVLAILADEFPSGYGHINFVRLAESCGVSRSTLKAQIHVLEKSGLIQLGSPHKTGRDIFINFLLRGNDKR